jgi:WD40 repeat protein
VFSADPHSPHFAPIATEADAHDLGVTCLSLSKIGGASPNTSVVTKDLLVSGGTDCAVKVWELNASTWKGTAELIPFGKPLLGHSGTVMSVCFHPFEKLAFSAGGDKTVRVWDVVSTSTLGGKRILAYIADMKVVVYLISASLVTFSNHDSFEQ